MAKQLYVISLWTIAIPTLIYSIYTFSNALSKLNKVQKTQSIPTVDESPPYKDFIINSLHNIYNTTITFINTEKKIIWSRFIAFNVLNGFFINIIFNATASSNHTTNIYSHLILPILLVGTILNTIWLMINYRGWNVLYKDMHIASKIYSGIQKPDLPTDWHETNTDKLGLIYYCAQVPPVLFIVLYTITFGYIITLITEIIPLAIFLSSALNTLLFRYFINKVTR